MFFKSIKVQLIGFLLFFAFFLSRENKDNFLWVLLFCAVSAILFEMLLGFLKKKKPVSWESALITGLIIGFVLSPDQPWWILAAATGIAVLSKYLILFKNRHIFNPAAFGVLVSMCFLGAQTQWKGTYLWYILLPAGIYFSWKIRKLELLSGYFIFALLLFGGQALIQKVPLSNIFGYLSYFFIFIMVIEPKTTPVKSLGKIIFGAGTAVLIFILTQAGLRTDVELVSLLSFNLLVPALNKFDFKKGGVL